MKWQDKKIKQPWLTIVWILMLAWLVYCGYVITH